jgi:hypothetical protein
LIPRILCAGVDLDNCRKVRNRKGEDWYIEFERLKVEASSLLITWVLNIEARYRAHNPKPVFN